MIFIATLAIGLSLFGASDAAVCGTWTAPCGSFYNGTEYNGEQYIGTLDFEGLTSGNYSWYRSVFQKSM
jgi:hypothetical protein